MYTLLVIDDEASIRFAITETLQSETVRVLAAEDEREGLRMLQEESPEVILLDIRLGNRSGLYVFHDIRAIDPK